MNSVIFNAIVVGTIAVIVPQSPHHDLHAANAPLRIESCNVVPVYVPTFFGDNALSTSWPRASVWIKFANHSARSATDVTILLEGPDGAVTITDPGLFSSGVTIRQMLGPFAGLRGDERCGLYSVQFDDGVVWNGHEEG